MSLASEARAVSLLRRMLEIPSSSCHEAELARFLELAMRRMGLRSRIDEAGNAVGEAGRGGGPVVMLLGHLDTVPAYCPSGPKRAGSTAGARSGGGRAPCPVDFAAGPA